MFSQLMMDPYADILSKYVGDKNVDNYELTRVENSFKSLNEDLNCRMLRLEFRRLDGAAATAAAAAAAALLSIQEEEEEEEERDDEAEKWQRYWGDEARIDLVYYTRPLGIGHRLPIQRGFDKQVAFFGQVKPAIDGVLHHILEDSVDEYARHCVVARRNVLCFANHYANFAECPDAIMDEAHLLAAAEALARLHTYSLLAGNELSKPLDFIYPEAFEESVFVETPAEVLDSFIEMFVGMAEHCYLDAQWIGEYVRAGFEKARSARLDPRMRSTVCLGQADPRQMLFYKPHSEDPATRKCLLTDFTATQFAPRMLDVARLLYFQYSPLRRRQYEGPVIRAYYEQLCRLINDDLHPESREFEDLIGEYEEVRHIVMALCVCYYPTVYCEKRLFQDYNHNIADYQRRYFTIEEQSELLRMFETDDEARGFFEEFTEELVMAADRWKVEVRDPLEEKSNYEDAVEEEDQQEEAVEEKDRQQEMVEEKDPREEVVVEEVYRSDDEIEEIRRDEDVAELKYQLEDLTMKEYPYEDLVEQIWAYKNVTKESKLFDEYSN
ncbi:uncharacterized protein LOC111694323 [Trichogramma pretiosum]|uniref:uncharacterized protein LOC111694323 n=1 Tax=Trichogramma pretiosum TaxID=7493 RepID=UPI000C71A0DB|nr:uncharacterized protein LOC111694323 [Trichogramma pretiosum]